MNRNEWERAHKIAQAIHAADMEWTSKFSARMSAIAAGDRGGEQAAYPPSHPGFNRVMESIEQHDPMCMPLPPIGRPDDSLIGAISPEQQPTPSEVLGEDFYSKYAEWFFEGEDHS